MTRKPAHLKSVGHEVDVEILTKGKAVAEDFDAAQELYVQPKKQESRPISIRLPMDIIVRLRRVAERRNMGYQQLIKLFLAEALLRQQQHIEVWSSNVFQEGYPVGERYVAGSASDYPSTEGNMADFIIHE